MNARKIVLVFLIFILSCAASPAAAYDDWAFQLGDEAKEIYAKKQIQIPCNLIDNLIGNNDATGLYVAIRDAALFGDRTCKKYIKKNYNHLIKLVGVKDAVAFYNYKNGDGSALESLAQTFDKDARKIGDHSTVDLFGFLDDWKISGRRLVRHANYTQEVGGELLCSAVMWRRYLYGEKNFKNHWFQIGKEENVSLKKLNYYYDTCHP